MSSRIVLNSENGRVERKDRKDNASGTGTRAVGCSLGYSSENQTPCTLQTIAPGSSQPHSVGEDTGVVLYT